MIAIALSVLLTAASAAEKSSARLSYVLHLVKRVDGGTLYEDLRRKATVFLPADFQLVDFRDDLTEFAMRNKTEAFELRFRFDSDERLRDSAAKAHAAGPDVPSPDLAAAMIQNLAQAAHPPSRRAFAQFPAQAVKKEFGADWGFILQQRVPIRNPDLARNFKYCQVFTIHQNGVGTYTIFQLYRADSFEDYKRVAMGASFHAVKFKPRKDE